MSPLRYGPSLAAPARAGRTATCCSRSRTCGRTSSWWTGRRWPGCWSRPAGAGAGAQRLPLRLRRGAEHAGRRPRPPGRDGRGARPDPGLRVAGGGGRRRGRRRGGGDALQRLRRHRRPVRRRPLHRTCWPGARSGGRRPRPARRWPPTPPGTSARSRSRCRTGSCPRSTRPLPLTLLAPAAAVTTGPITAAHHAARPVRGVGGAGVPAGPDVGFFGRDETLLALDRAFDTTGSCCCTPWPGRARPPPRRSSPAGTPPPAACATPTAGPGRCCGPPSSTTSRWTGCSTTPAPRSRRCWRPTASTGRRSPTAAERRDLVLQLLAQVPVLWVWDNVEPVAGFPAGTPSAWTADEQAELRRLPARRSGRHPGEGAAHLAARRARLAGRPAAVRVAAAADADAGTPAARPTPLVRHHAPDATRRRRRRLAAAAAVHRRQPADHHRHGPPGPARARSPPPSRSRRSWPGSRPGHAAGDRPRTPRWAGHRSLAASLAYGFTHAFTEPERAQLAVLHLFRDTVDVDALRLMGDPDTARTDAVPALAGADRDGLIALLDRAVELGPAHRLRRRLLRHPPRPALVLHHPLPPSTSPPTTAAARGRNAPTPTPTPPSAATTSTRSSRAGPPDVLPALRAEEANLLHALDLARAHQLPDAALGCLQGLNQLYDLTGRDGEWARLVADIEGDYVDPATDQPRPGREDDYSVITGYRVRIARDRRDWPTATRLQTARTAWDRDRAAPYLDLPPEQLDDTARHHLRTLAVSEQDLGQLLLRAGRPRLPATTSRPPTTWPSGSATPPARPSPRPASATPTWPCPGCATSTRPSTGTNAASTSHPSTTGSAAPPPTARSPTSPTTGSATPAPPAPPTTELLAHLDAARAGYQQALDLLPADHHDYRATAHNQLGNIYAAGRGRAAGPAPLPAGHPAQGGPRRHLRRRAHPLQHRPAPRRCGRPGDALHYARAALTNFREVGPGADPAADKVLALIDALPDPA